jgi:predicted RNA-binding Zn-ribbon protein involved in translation (DUF1610 family)
MPKPNGIETQEQFVSRCIPIVIDEGTTSDNSQAAAICHSIWDQHHKSVILCTCVCGTKINNEDGMGYAKCPSCGEIVNTAKVDTAGLQKSIAEKKTLIANGQIIIK